MFVHWQNNGIGDNYYMQLVGQVFDDTIHDVCFDYLGNFFVVGSSYVRETTGSVGTTNVPRYYVAKYDPNGQRQWHKMAGNYLGSIGYSITFNNGVSFGTNGLLGGNGFSVLHVLGKAFNSATPSLLTFTSSGGYSGYKTISGGLTNTTSSVTSDALDNIYLVGCGTVMHIAQLNFIHNIIWQKRCTTLNGNTSRPKFDSAGYGYVVATASTSAVLLKFDNLGNIIWQRSIANHTVGDLHITSDDKIYIAGRYNTGTYNQALLQFNTSGTIINQVHFDMGTLDSSNITSITSDSQGMIYIGGNTTTNLGFIIFYDTIVGTVIARSLQCILNRVEVSGNNLLAVGISSQSGQGSQDMFMAILPSNGDLLGTYLNIAYSNITITKSTPITETITTSTHSFSTSTDLIMDPNPPSNQETYFNTLTTTNPLITTRQDF